MRRTRRSWWVGFLVLGSLWLHGAGAARFTVATYNLENYLVTRAGTRPVKSAAARAKVRESLLRLRPDVLALEEIGPTNALFELRDSLRRAGLNYPFWEHVRGFDTNIFVAVLSRFPIVARHPHPRQSYLYHRRRLFVSRGFAEVVIRVNPHYTFTLLAAHLKSRRRVSYGDQAELREHEALRLRAQVNRLLRRNPAINLVVLGDFNDTQDSRPIKTIRGRGARALLDTRPAERNGDNAPAVHPRYAPRRITWTYYYGKADTYERIDYLLVSRGLAREWQPTGTYVLALPNWGVASDHRPIIATFVATDR